MSRVDAIFYYNPHLIFKIVCVPGAMCPRHYVLVLSVYHYIRPPVYSFSVYHCDNLMSFDRIYFIPWNSRSSLKMGGFAHICKPKNNFFVTEILE